VVNNDSYERTPPEVRHGFAIFNKFFADAARRASFTAALDACPVPLRIYA
jgi:hypothetical protein